MISTSPQTIPIVGARCPAHGQLVALDGEGRLLGLCSGCAREAAQATIDIQQGVAAANMWATETLDRIGRRK